MDTAIVVSIITGAVTLIVPPVMTRSSFTEMPCMKDPFTVRLPLPLIVRSSWEKIAPSAPPLTASSL